MNEFSKNFSDLLRIRTLTQKQLAEKLNVRPSTVNQWAKGKREPTFDNLLKICLFLDTSPSELLGYQKFKMQNL